MRAGKRLKDTAKIVSSAPLRARFHVAIPRTYGINVRARAAANRNTAAFAKQMFNFRN